MTEKPADEGLSGEEPFYVGYLRAPLRLIRFITIMLILVVLSADGLALVVARLQQARPSGQWDQNGEVAITGRLVARPYPLVLVPATPERAAHAVLLVSEGKRGAPREIAALDGKQVTVRGYELLRDDLTVLQLSQDASEAPADGPPPAAEAADLGSRTLTGEIVDAKCFLGAMNPGEGKVHMGCASLCLLGGIPPLFVTRDAAGKPTYRLLADATGDPLAEAALSRAGEFLTLTGALRRLDGIEVFAVPASALE